MLDLASSASTLVSPGDVVGVFVSARAQDLAVEIFGRARDFHLEMRFFDWELDLEVVLVEERRAFCAG